MDALKIQTDILKGLYKGKIKGMYIQRSDDCIYIGTDGYAVYKIPKDKFYLDISKYNDVDMIKGHIDKALNGEPATKVTRFTKPNDGKIAVALEITSDNWVTYVNYDLIKPFESKKSVLTFTVVDSISAVGVWENGKMIGIVMPFRPSKNGVEMTKYGERNYYE